MIYHVLQIRDIQAVVQLIGPTNFLIVCATFLLYQLYSPNALPDTKFQQIVKKFEGKIDDIQESLGGRLSEIEQKQLASIQIIRAIASVKNPAEEIDDSMVDDYLIQNGVDKDKFLLGKQVTDGGETQFDHLSDEKIQELMEELQRSHENNNNNTNESE